MSDIEERRKKTKLMLIALSVGATLLFIGIFLVFAASVHDMG